MTKLGNFAPAHDKRSFLSRNTKGTLILIFWLVMMAALFVRYSHNRALHDAVGKLDPNQIAANWKDSSEYAVISASDTIVGGLVTTTTREALPTPSYLVQAFASARLGGRLLPLVRVSMRARLDDQFHLMDFAAAGELPVTRFRIVGKIRFPELWLEVHSSDVVRRGRFRLEKPIALADTFRSVVLRSSEIRPGVKFSYDAVDPLWNMRLGRVEVEIGEEEEISVRGKVERGYRVTTRYGDVVSRGWVDGTGRVIKQQILGSLALERATATEVAEWLRRDELTNMTEEMDENAFRKLPLQPFQPQSVLSIGEASN